MSNPLTIDLGSVVGPSAFVDWCARQVPVLDPGDAASWTAFVAAMKGERGLPGADGLTQSQVDARIADAGLQPALTFDATPTEDSQNPVTSGGVQAALAGKQDSLEFDATPTEDSQNPVTSGGVQAAIVGAVAGADIGDTGWIELPMAAAVTAGSIRYRVKNGVLFLSGRFSLKNGTVVALTTQRIPTDVMPGTHYGSVRVPVPALLHLDIWRAGALWLYCDDGLFYSHGVADYRLDAPVAAGPSVTMQIQGNAWVLDPA